MRRVIAPKRVMDYARKYPSAQPSLMHWLEVVQHAQWANSADIKATFNDVDVVTTRSRRTVYVFNIEHNRHRLIAAIHYNTSTVYVLRILTHRQYDGGKWKDEL